MKVLVTYYSESGNGIGYTYLNLRGFDQRRVSVLINGVPQNDPEDHMVYWLDFPDLAANLEDVHQANFPAKKYYDACKFGAFYQHKRN